MSAKQRVLAATTLGIIFALSVVARLPMLNKPLSHPSEWLSATVLRHLQIWHETGIARAHFAPIMTYPGQADKNINNNASDHMDPEGNYYYTSYPPLAYYAPYVIFEALHVYPDVLPLQIFSLVLHFISGIGVYLALKLLLDCEDELCIPAIFGFTVYIFSPETLWLQANVYMSDMFAQAFFIAGIYWALILARKRPAKTSAYVLFACFIFCFVYTEWLGVMFSLTMGAYAWRYRDQPGMKSLQIAIASGMVAALGLMLWQYSWIDGVKAFWASSASKFLFRSGLGQQVGLTLHPWNILGWLLIGTWYLLGYASDFVLLLLLWIVAWRRGRAFHLANNLKTALIVSAALPVILHHLIFFNFTANHGFSVLKAAPVIAIGAGILAWRLWNGGSSTSASPALVRPFVCCCLLLFAIASVWEYKRLAGPRIFAYKEIGENIARNSKSDEVIFVAYRDPTDEPDQPPPQLVFYAHRNIARWQNEAQARQLARQNGISKAIIFFLDAAELSVVEIRHIRL